jgi:ketosteroid isomerase-like protein
MSKSRTPLLDPSALPMLRLFAVLVLLLESAMVGAVDLGVLHWKTVAGKPGFAEIELKDRVPIDAATLRVSIASRDAYALAGLTYHPSLAKARLSVQAAGNRPVLRIDNLPQDQQWLDLIVVVSNRLSLSLAEYRVGLQKGPQEIAPSPAGTLQVRPAQAAANAKVEKPQTATIRTVDDDSRASARQAVQAWAQAWSERDVDSYIGAYTADYSGDRAGLTHQDWVEQRRTRILARKGISLELVDLGLERDGDTIIATFEQRYRSDGLRDRIRKRMLLVQADGRWLIKRETTLH